MLGILDFSVSVGMRLEIREIGEEQKQKAKKKKGKISWREWLQNGLRTTGRATSPGPEGGGGGYMLKMKTIGCIHVENNGRI